jgi:hypothetical protein
LLKPSNDAVFGGRCGWSILQRFLSKSTIRNRL